MSVQLEQIYDWTTAPPVVPRRFDAMSVIDFDDESDAHGALGLQWESTACGSTNNVEGPCTPTPAELLTEACPAYGIASPTTVYGLYTDSLGSRRPLSQHEELARARFLATEAGGLDALVAAYLVAEETTLVVSSSPSDHTEAVKLALGEIEQAIMQGGTGVQTQTERVIFMSAVEAILLGDDLSASGGTLRTVLGSRVAVLSASLGGKLYGTGVWKGHRGPIYVDNAAPDRSINDSSILVQRNYAVGTACGVLGATIPTPV
jgi:hypothetical protein